MKRPLVLALVAVLVFLGRRGGFTSIHAAADEGFRLSGGGLGGDAGVTIGAVLYDGGVEAGDVFEEAEEAVTLT